MEIILKDFIESNCFTKSGRHGFNNRCSLKSWWTNKNFDDQYDQIFKLTEFLPEEIGIAQRCWHIYNSIYTKPLCSVCNSPTNFDSFSSGYYQLCSKACSYKDSNRNEAISKFDRTQMLETTKKTMIEKYGVKSYYQSEQFKDKSKKTKLEKYGDENYNNFDKNKKTCLKKYGNEFYFKSEIGKKHLKTIRDKNFGSLKVNLESNIILNDIPQLLELNKTHTINEIADMIGVSGSAVYKKIIGNGYDIVSHPAKYNKLQGQLLEDIKSFYQGKIFFNDRKTIKPKELDIYLPERKLAIELNGLYWHAGNEDHHKFKHLDKLKLCKENGIQLIQFTDKEYKENRDLVINTIKSYLGIYEKTIRASKCKIVNIDTKTEKQFLDSYHFQGNSRSSVKYGLEFNCELVAVMTFGKSRFNKKYEWELIRLCNKPGIKIHGGASKLFNHFIKTMNPNSVISYCDISKFTGNVYKNIGFKYLHTSVPNYVYIKSNITLSRYQAQKHKLNNIVETYYPDLSEAINMEIDGWEKYWDCGNDVYGLECSRS